MNSERLEALYDAICDTEFMRTLNTAVIERGQPECQHAAWHALFLVAEIASGDPRKANEWVRDLRGTK